MKILKALLQEGIVEVEFTKVNGDLRKMVCTTDYDIIPDDKHPIDASVKVVNESLIRVYDTEAKGWRSFRADSVITFRKQ
tara:strand:+ start:1097 stop:1336 length:240 start_codon:yes stop_codon:yes gene_type:complete